MPKTDTEIGKLAGARVDRKIYLSKQFVSIWRVAQTFEKVQFLDFLSNRALCPPIFLGACEQLVGIPVRDPFDWLCTVHLLSTSSREYAGLRSDRTACFNTFSQQRAF